MSDPTRTENEPIRRYEHELSAFRRLVQLCDAYQLTISRTERATLAFFVEDFRKQNGGDWLQAFEVFLSELEMIIDQEGVAAGTARLARETKDRYSVFLADAKRHELNPTRQKNLAVLEQRIEKDWITRAKIIQEKNSVPIGSVITEHNPPWYQYT